MKIIGHLTYHVDMLKNQCSRRKLRTIAPECVLSDESAQKEDEDTIDRDNNQSVSSVNKKNKPRNKCSSDELANRRNKHEALESVSDDYEENEKKYWEEDFSI